MQWLIPDAIVMLAAASDEYCHLSCFTAEIHLYGADTLLRSRHGVMPLWMEFEYGAGSVDIVGRRAIPADTKQMDGYFIQWSRELTGTRAQVLLRWLYVRYSTLLLVQRLYIIQQSMCMPFVVYEQVGACILSSICRPNMVDLFVVLIAASN